MDSLSTVRVPSNRRRGGEQGYVLLYLLMVVALMGIVAMAVLVPLKFELQRDREEEMIHRGVQYSRAIRNYYKKFGRYPTRLEDLDNTNNLRYLRKHYKDPETGKDFKLLHYGDPGLSMGGSIGGGGITGANTVGQMNGAAAGNSAFGGSGSGSSFGQSSSFGGSSGGFGNSSGSSFGGGSSGGFGGSSGSSFGGSSNSFGSGTSSQGSGTQSGTNSTGTTTTGTDPAQSGTGAAQDASSGQSGASGQGNNQVFGGGPIVGVASLSKDKTIREFNHKHKYNEWQFVYDPTTDRGGLILTPYQPALQIAGQQMNGQPGQPGSTGAAGGSPSSFGQQSPFGQSSFGQSSGQSSGFGNSGPSPQQPPSSSSPPQ